MPRIDVNRSGEMEAFVQVVERGGFSAAARALGMTPSAVSKLVARLESRLAVQLVHRSTRKLTLTPEGQQFHERSVRVLADMDEAERCAASGAAPRGRVSINASVPFGHHVLLPLMPRFLEGHPQVTVDVSLTDRVVDLMDERTDIAVRWGQLPSSDLVARRLGETGQAIVASPAYLARYGTPHTPEELEAHNRLGTSYRRAVPDWPLSVDGRFVEMPIVGNMRVGDGSALRRLVLDGVGLGRLSLYHVQADIDAGRLVKVMEAFNPHEMEPIHAVYLGKAGRLPARVRAMLDFLVAHVKLDGATRGMA
ncbi:LysR family transcriptional regulator [Variovorax arabinosiphilus]|uniref:LysR family transcriptional regulator n=1 Tax=Variovorax arabinosiphilus TaxID=3053498 RepID=UPI0025774EA8|nr:MULTISPECIES: LysR family transcriptional regulator [unclassified Variovorax]MDM0118548.1 LysR family transcriptional regulator [Variovorax sp. J2L1-78]MDM0128973.1 LysR family transcriptional regulator [Variovorax sp. J2L1-63]MDM0233242.1 LysR family transcriptional regulator [Variovorax sp. J2R1-6]